MPYRKPSSHFLSLRLATSIPNIVSHRIGIPFLSHCSTALFQRKIINSDVSARLCLSSLVYWNFHFSSPRDSASEGTSKNSYLHCIISIPEWLQQQNPTQREAFNKNNQEKSLLSVSLHIFRTETTSCDWKHYQRFSSYRNNFDKFKAKLAKNKLKVTWNPSRSRNPSTTASFFSALTKSLSAAW